MTAHPPTPWPADGSPCSLCTPPRPDRDWASKFHHRWWRPRLHHLMLESDKRLMNEGALEGGESEPMEKGGQQDGPKGAGVEGGGEAGADAGQEEGGDSEVCVCVFVPFVRASSV